MAGGWWLVAGDWMKNGSTHIITSLEPTKSHINAPSSQIVCEPFQEGRKAGWVPHYAELRGGRMFLHTETAEESRRGRQGVAGTGAVPLLTMAVDSVVINE